MATTVQPEMQNGREVAAGFLGLYSVFQWACLLFGGAVLGYLLILPLEWNQQLFLSVALIVLAVLINRFSSRHFATIVLVAISVFASSRYIYYRVTNTFGLG